MQGYILNVIPMRNEDIIVKILCPKSYRSFYRFYGARHSLINVGNKIDFDEKLTPHFLPQLHNILQLSYPWHDRLICLLAWQKFLSLLDKHLDGVDEVDGFYFELLEESTKKLTKQNPLRTLLEAYAKLLEFEGRIYTNDECFICSTPLKDDISLGRSFLFAHTQCAHDEGFEKGKIIDFLLHKSSICLEDNVVEKMWKILCQGF